MFLHQYRKLLKFKNKEIHLLMIEATTDNAIIKNFVEDFKSGGKTYACSKSPTSSTPSTNDLKLRDWMSRGTAGISATSVVEAASNTRTSEVVVMKSLRRSSRQSVQKIQQEVNT